MIDEGDSFEVIQNKYLSNEITIEKLHGAALTNTAVTLSDRTEINDDPTNIMMVTNGGNFEATMLMANFLWEQNEPVFNDTICVAISANGLFFIAPKNNSAAREKTKDGGQRMR